MPNFKSNLALVLSGGGAKGAFQVGVMEELISRKGVEFDIFGGVSTGCLQAVGGAQGQIEEMKQFWLAIENRKDIYKKRFFGLIGGVFGADSLYKAKPLRDKIRDFVKPQLLQASGKKLIVGAVSLQTGEFTAYREDDPDIAEWIIASTAVPVAFKTLEKDDEQHVDGGVRDLTPLSAVMDLKPSAIIVVLASPRAREPKDKKFDNLIKIGMRSVGILENEVFRTDVSRAELINDLVAANEALAANVAGLNLSDAEKLTLTSTFSSTLARYNIVPIFIIEPDELFYESLEFDPAKIRDAMESGRQIVRDQWAAIEAFVTDA